MIESDVWDLMWMSVTHLPIVEPEVIRKVAASFDGNTAQTFDGYHPRHYALMSDGALRCVGLMWAIMEACGMRPTQLQANITAFLGKPTGGNRPIGLWPSSHRVCGAARRGYCQDWEAAHDEELWAMSKGRSAMDLVWREAALSEWGGGSGHACSQSFVGWSQVL